MRGILAVAMVVGAISLDARMFRDTTGRSVEAEVQSFDGQTVVLINPEGKTLAVPLERFSAEDQEFIRSEHAGPKTAESTAPVPVGGGADLEWEYDAEPRNVTGLNVAKFRVWIPTGLSEVRGMIVLMPGANGDGRGAAVAGDWQALARELGFGLIACFMKGDGEAAGYCYADDVSGKVLLGAIEEFAKSHQRPDVAKAPLLLWGHSAGGQFNYNFARWQPERVLGFVVNKGGFYYDRRVPPAMRKVPALFFIGVADTEERRTNITKAFEDGRSRGALWAFCADSGGHEEGRSRSVAQTFFKSVASARLIEDGDRKLADLDEKSGWLGDLKTRDMAAYEGFAGNKRAAAWLVDESAAEAWRSLAN